MLGHVVNSHGNDISNFTVERGNNPSSLRERIDNDKADGFSIEAV